MIKYGLKLWTTNKDLFADAISLFHNGQIDFVELYIVPNFFKFSDLLPFKIMPTVIHAPHTKHNFNIFELNEEKIEIFKSQVVSVADMLGSKYIVVHAGVGSDNEVFKTNLQRIYDSRIIIENKPKRPLFLSGNCYGYSLEQLKFIKEDCGMKICLDIGHAVKSAISQKLDYKDYLSKLMIELKPRYFHISGVKLSNELDEHLDLKYSEMDLIWISRLINEISKNNEVNVVLETPKTQGLKNDLENIKYFQTVI